LGDRRRKTHNLVYRVWDRGAERRGETYLHVN